MDTGGEMSDREALAKLTKRQLAGVKLTEQIMTAVEPIVHGLPTDLVIEAMAAAMSATLVGAQVSTLDARLVLHRYAERILDFAEEID
jgi:hypothetical protein